jgi:hypothetical protein
LGLSRSNICSRAEAEPRIDHAGEWQQSSSAVQRHEIDFKIEDRSIEAKLRTSRDKESSSSID